ncbi:MAG: ATP-dependent DNA helicase [Gammaproteobacteria bacterium]
MLRFADTFAADGPLAALVEGFRPRAQQIEMAQAVAEAIAERGMLVCEAGTGTGKTFAYLTAALQSGLRVVVSTGTRTLQDQLFHRDLPLVRRALGIGVRVALLKGRSNYLCLHRLELCETPGALFEEPGADLAQVRQWSARTGGGDIAELATVPENAPIWAQVTSTADNCLGTQCPRYDDCFVMHARRDAVAADVVVVNHHLFFADLTLREEGVGELIPSADVVIFDEAHQLADLASEFFGVSVSSRQLLDLARDAVAAHAAEAGDMPELVRRAVDLEGAVRDAAARLGVQERRVQWELAAREPGLAPALAALADRSRALAEALDALAERGVQLANVARRAADFSARLTQFHDDGEAGGAPVVRWLATQKRAFGLHVTPVDVAGMFRGRLDRYPAAFVFTSATLAVGEDFSLFTERLGLAGATTRRWESPYDMRRQALLYVPDHRLEPSAPGYTQAVCEVAEQVLAASRGRAFVLFTSHRALREAAGRLSRTLAYPVLVQGDAPRGEMLERFRRTPNAVLLGTGSFWEGVDVRGEALSCVVIDKLPFAAPDDPILKARSERLRSEGGNPFSDLQLPEAVIALKQGMGRLIRDETDRGVLVICDTRLVERSYGKVFLRGLPPMTLTRDIDDVRAFFASPAPAAEGSSR